MSTKRTILFAALLASVASYAGINGLTDRLKAIAGTNDVGVALITCYGDTVSLNGSDTYDMASVCKFFQAAAIACTTDYDELTGTEITIDPAELEPNTWSPLRASAGKEKFRLSPAQLLDYSLMVSDNNAADILSDRLCSPARVDSILRAKGYPGEYRIAFTEKEMHADSLGAVNTCSPVAAAAAINRFFTADTTASATLVKALMSRESPFGKERIIAGLVGKDAKVFHKTGTGFNATNGTPAALNDLAFVSFKTEWGYSCYSLAVFVRNFSGSRAEGEKMIADISAAVWDAVIVNEVEMANSLARVPANKVSRPTVTVRQNTWKSLLGDMFECVVEEAFNHALGIDE